MRIRRLLPLLALLALLAAPFGRPAAAEAMAMAMPNHGSAAAGHCDGMPVSDPATDEGAAIDCMTACAAIAAAAGPALEPAPAAEGAPAGAAPPAIAGLHPESEPPPPRFS